MSWPWIAAFLAPAAIMALVLLTHQPLGMDPFYTGLHGTVRLTLLAADGPVRDGATLDAGTKLQVRISVPKPGYLLVVGVDDRGTVAAYEPPNATGSMALSAGETALPTPLPVNVPPGPERIYALFTEHPVAVSDVADAVRAAHASAKDGELPVHGAQSSVLLEKQIR